MAFGPITPTFPLLGSLGPLPAPDELPLGYFFSNVATSGVPGGIGSAAKTAARSSVNLVPLTQYGIGRPNHVMVLPLVVNDAEPLPCDAGWAVHSQ